MLEPEKVSHRVLQSRCGFVPWAEFFSRQGKRALEDLLGSVHLSALVQRERFPGKLHDFAVGFLEVGLAKQQYHPRRRTGERAPSRHDQGPRRGEGQGEPAQTSQHCPGAGQGCIGEPKGALHAIACESTGQTHPQRLGTRQDSAGARGPAHRRTRPRPPASRPR